MQMDVQEKIEKTKTAAMKTKPSEATAAASFGAIILAGGYSSRMKAFKPLLPVGRSTAIETLIAAFRDAGIANIAVVSGHNREKLLPVIKRAGVDEVYNANYDAGMFSSIRAGLGYAKGAFTRVQGFFLIPVDCPLIGKAVLERLMEAAEAGLLGKGDAALDEAAGSLASNGVFAFQPVNDALPAGGVKKVVTKIAMGEEMGKPVAAAMAVTAGSHEAVNGVAVNDALPAGGLKKAVTKSAKTMKNFYVPVFEGKKGHPLLIPVAYSEEICSYDGPGGLKAITDRYWDRMIRVSVEDEGCLLDMDTPAGYEEILDFQKSGGRRESLQELAAGRRIFLVRHGQTRQHAEKMFIGRYDVPLSEDARGQVEAMAESLASVLADQAACRDASSPCIPVADKVVCSDSLNCCIPAADGGASKHDHPAERSGGAAIRGGVIYTSPLRRAQQTAEIIWDVLMQEATHDRKFMSAAPKIKQRNDDEGENRCAWEVRQVADLQEIALGDWDGKPIREIKEQYPLEYERRGADIFAFKTGNRAENFYDVQYRVVKALRRILLEDSSRDIILVTHSTVIRALENNLKGLRVDDPWEQLPKNDFRVITL